MQSAQGLKIGAAVDLGREVAGDDSESDQDPDQDSEEDSEDEPMVTDPQAT